MPKVPKMPKVMECAFSATICYTYQARRILNEFETFIYKALMGEAVPRVPRTHDNAGNGRLGLVKYSPQPPPASSRNFTESPSSRTREA